MPTCIIMEKKTAFKNMVEAIKGHIINPLEASATYNGHHYLITHAQGHLLKFTAPTKMIKSSALKKNPKLKAQIGSWNVNAPLWNYKDLNWKHEVIKASSYILRGLTRVVNKCSAVIIAGDTDATGEGDELQMEILNHIHWHGPIYRIRFDDDSVHSELRHALHHITNMHDSTNMGIYLKAVGRARWDFIAGLQDTRKATSYAKANGFKVRVANEGRLKSAIMVQTRKRWLAHNNYVKKPYWEVQFKDVNGHIYSRKASYKSHPDFRLTDQNKAKDDLQKYHNSKPANIKTNIKKQSPGKLLNLASLGAILNKRGFSPMGVQSTYQKMYENGYVSYPRTDDKKITLGQWKMLEPMANKIAKVVGVNPKLLTYRKPRKEVLTKHADHGANRPGPKIPSSLDALKAFGASGPAIYKTLSKNYLAILAPDYVYKHITAQLSDYPKFKTSFNIPLKMNYKLVFDANANKKKNNTKPLGNIDKPFLHQGTNPRTPKPNTSWLYRMLNKYNIGTGATRQGTVAQISSGSHKKLDVKRGILNMTNEGIVCAEMAENTMIGNVKVTATLYKMMDGIRAGKVSIENVEATATALVKHDKPIFAKNAKHLTAPKMPKREYFTATVDNKSRKINRIFMGHRFTDNEVKQFQDDANKVITIGPFKKGNYKFKVQGDLAKNTVKPKGKKAFSWYGFHPIKFISNADKDKVPVKIGNQIVKIHRTWAHHRFTNNELHALSQQKKIKISGCKSKKGTTFGAIGKLAKQKMGSNVFYGFKMLKYIPNAQQQAKYKKWQQQKAKRKANSIKATINGKTGTFPSTFCKHKWTPDEIKILKKGKVVNDTFTSRKGKSFKAFVELKWSKYRGKPQLGFKLKFH